MWPWTSLNSPWLKAALGVAVCLVCFGLGIRWQRGEDAIEQMQTTARIAAARKKQEEQDAKSNAVRAAELATLRQETRDHTRKVQSHATNPDRAAPVPDDLLRELDAAAGAPAAP